MSAVTNAAIPGIEEIRTMGERNVIKAALLGAGTVGSGVYALAEMLKDEMFQKTGASLEIKKVLVRNTKKDRPGIPKEIMTDNWQEILEDEEIQLVIELMGGVEPARTYIVQALEAGKQVVTANKDVLAEHGQEILSLAENSGCDIQFEAAVAGAIPIIRPLKQSLAGSMLTEIMGIVNGTTNYILTKMSEEGMDYKEALAEATELGYAEADPTADVEGLDAGRKMAIMASIAFHSRVVFDDVYTEGITSITAEDIRYATAMNKSIKLLGNSWRVDGKIYAMVCPMLLDNAHPLSGVNDVFNAIFVRGNMVDETMFYGKGAGKLPTASAVAADVVDCVKHTGKNIKILWNPEKLTLSDLGDFERQYFVRMPADAEAKAITAAFGAVEMVSVEGINEKAFITGVMKESAFNEAAEKAGHIINRIRLD